MTTESKAKNGTLTLGGVDFAAQASSVEVRPTHDTQGDPLELQDGTVLPATTTRGNTLALTAVQDWTDAAGFVNYTWDNDLIVVPFTWAPRGATGPTWTGDVEVRAVVIGGEMNTRLTTDAEWTCVGAVTRTPAAP